VGPQATQKTIVSLRGAPCDSQALRPRRSPLAVTAHGRRISGCLQVIAVDEAEWPGS
jgi:hypothetical protein